MCRFVMPIAAAVLSISATAFAQGMPISTDGTDPKTWDPALDAVKSGAKNHKIIYEDTEIRVLSVTVEPGEVEVAHHHAWPSVIVFDRPTRLENRDANGKLLPAKIEPGQKLEMPIILRVPSEAAHAVTNVDTTPMHLIRVEFKNGFPKQP